MTVERSSFSQNYSNIHFTVQQLSNNGFRAKILYSDLEKGTLDKSVSSNLFILTFRCDLTRKFSTKISSLADKIAHRPGVRFRGSSCPIEVSLCVPLLLNFENVNFTVDITKSTTNFNHLQYMQPVHYINKPGPTLVKNLLQYSKIENFLKKIFSQCRKTERGTL